MKIEDYKKKGKTYIIAEIGQAHDGSLGILHSLIKAISLLGIDAVKFQVFNLNEIAKIDDVDCLWVGHFDLSNFLGVPGQFDSKLYLDAINRIVKAGTKYKKSLGIMVSTRQEMDFYFDLGFNVIAVGTEMNLLMDKISNLLKK